MKKNNGVTIISLAIYVIALSIIIGLFSVYTSSYSKNIALASKTGANANELTKLYSVMVKDIKNANYLLVYNHDYLKFDTNIEYEVVGDNIKSELFRDGISIARLKGAINFDFDDGALVISGDSFENRFLVGRGY